MADFDSVPMDIISGACLLSHDELTALSPAATPSDLERMCSNHPNSTDLAISGMALLRGRTVHYWLETHEFAALVEDITEGSITYQAALPVLIEEAERIKSVAPFAPQTNFYLTHVPETSQRLIELAVKYAPEVRRQLLNTPSSIPRPYKLLRLMKKRPGECNALRIFCTYSAEAIERERAFMVETIETHITFGLFTSGSRWPSMAYDVFGTDFILIRRKPETLAQHLRLAYKQTGT